MCQGAGERKAFGVKVARGCPIINHLLFVDDIMFFCKANNKSCKKLKRILSKYEEISGQLINYQKSSISFSRHAPQSLKAKMMNILQINKEGGEYLGLPEYFGKKKKDMFTSIVDKIKHKAASWSTKLLSGAGKLVLLKNVLASMPTYAVT